MPRPLHGRGEITIFLRAHHHLRVWAIVFSCKSNGLSVHCKETMEICLPPRGPRRPKTQLGWSDWCPKVLLSVIVVLLRCVDRKLYWTECGSNPRVMSMNLDASEPIAVVTGGVRCPSSLRLDLPRRHLYWVDSQLGVVASVTTDGRHRRVCF